MKQQPKLKIMKQQPKQLPKPGNYHITKHTHIPNQLTTNLLHLHGTGHFLGSKPYH